MTKSSSRKQTPRKPASRRRGSRKRGVGGGARSAIIPYNVVTARTDTLVGADAVGTRFVASERLCSVLAEDGESYAQGFSMLDMDTSRLRRFAALFEQWRVNAVAFEYVPLVSFTHAGALILSFDFDPVDVPTGSTEDVRARELLGNMNSIETAISQKALMRIKGINLDNLLWTDPVEGLRTISFGNLFMMTQGTGAAAGTTLGWINIHYDISFFRPQLVASSLIPVGVVTNMTCTTGPPGADTNRTSTSRDLTVVTTAGAWTSGRVWELGSSQQVNRLFTGIIDSYTGEAGLYRSGSTSAIPLGARIFWNMAKSHFVDDSVAGETLTNYITPTAVGEIRLGSPVSPFILSTLGRAATGVIGLRSVYAWNDA